MRLTLYQRDDCHLCDLALEVMAQVPAPEFESVFIDDDVALEALYGARVPVLRETASAGETGNGSEMGGWRELDWPFDAEGLRAWLALTGKQGRG